MSSTGIRAATSAATLDLPIAVGPKMPITVTGGFSTPLAEYRSDEHHSQDQDRVGCLSRHGVPAGAGDALCVERGRRVRERLGPAAARQSDLVRRRLR